jgi:hypothetical protein
MTPDKCYQANSVVSCGDEGDEGAILFNPDTDDTMIVNPTGRAVWAFLAAPRSMDEIAAHITATFRGVSAERAAQDAAQFI